MNPETESNLKRDAAKMSRREFLRTAALAGVSAPVALAMFSEAVAQSPRKGGHLVLGLAGGALGVMRAVKEVRAAGKNAVAVLLDGVNPDIPLLMADYHFVIQPDGGGSGAGKFGNDRAPEEVWLEG